MKLSPETVWSMLAYILMTVCAILAVAPRATYWILLCVIGLALYMAGWSVELLMVVILGGATWALLWIGANRSKPQPQGE
jgi:hypothetical protein